MPDTIHVCKIKWVRGLVEARWDRMAEKGAVNIWRCLEKRFKKEKSATIENIINFALKFQCLLHLCQIHPLGPSPPFPRDSYAYLGQGARLLLRARLCIWMFLYMGQF